MILLCAATSFEIQPTLQFIKAQQLDKQVKVLFTGIGLLASTYELTRAVYQSRPDILIQAGIAGALDESLALATTVSVASECIGDLGVVENQIFTDLFRLGLAEKNQDPYLETKLVNRHSLLSQCGIPTVHAVSVNEITTDPERILYYRQELGAQIESMEGAALHYVGLIEQIPFLQIRSISNYIGERNKQAWKLQEAITALNKELQQVIVKILKP
ncbi:MAG TPA: futalosine hydrolase [Flavisolibacter sp.]|nr:futalosine hydrolase [Flavisolibacter sp.]